MRLPVGEDQSLHVPRQCCASAVATIRRGLFGFELRVPIGGVADHNRRVPWCERNA